MNGPDREKTDFAAAKRRLLQMGRERGFVTDAEIGALLPREYTSRTEIEMLLFTFEMMEVDVRKSDGTLVKGAARIRLIAG
jgi:hypothetical protein